MAYRDFLRKMEAGTHQTLDLRPVCTKMVWQTLRAADATGSGLVKQEVLRNVLCNFLFPMSPHSFHQLTRRYGVKGGGPVKWKHFLGHFLDPAERTDSRPPSADGSLHQLLPKEISSDLEEVYSRLEGIFHLLDPSGSGGVARAELRRALEGPYLHPSRGRHPDRPPRLRLGPARVSQLLNLLDPGHTGLVQRARLETLWPCAGSTPRGRTPPSPSRTEGPAPILGERGEGGGRQTTLDWTIEDQTILDQTIVNQTIAGQTTLDQTTVDQTTVDQTTVDQTSAHCSPPPGPQGAPEHRILEDSWVVLEDGHFHHVTRLLGFKHGRLARTTLLDKYQEFSSRAVKQNGHGRHGDEHNKAHFLSAEECLAFMRAKMADDHADGASALRMRTADGDGVTDAGDLRETFRSLGLVASEQELRRALRLIGLRPGAKLPYARLRHAIQQGGAREMPRGTVNVLDQIQEQLASDLRYKRAFMLQALCGPEEDERELVFKKSLRNQLFTYDLPLRPAEFEQLWLRFDPEGRGCVTLVDFLNKLGVRHDGKSNASALQVPAADDRRRRDPDTLSDAEFTGVLQGVMREHREDVRTSLLSLDRKRDGWVSLDHLLSVLCTYSSASLRRDQLMAHLGRTKVPLDAGHRKLAYQDFLSAFPPQEEGGRQEVSPAETPQPAYRVETLHGLAPDQALSRLRGLVRSSAPVLHKGTGKRFISPLKRRTDSLSIPQAFSTFDPCGTGRINGVEFRRVLESVCAGLSDSQYRHMLGELDLNWEQQTVDWKLFLDRLRSPWQLPQAATDTSGRPITEVLGRIQDAVSRHLFDVTKAMVALERSGTDGISKEDFQGVCGRYVGLTPHQLPVSASGRLRSGEFLRRYGAAAVPACTSPAPGERASSTVSNARRPETAGAVLRPQREVARLPAKYDITNTGPASHQDFVRQFLLKLRSPGGNRAFQRNRLPPPTKTTGRPAVLTGQCVEVLLRVDRAVRLSWRSIRHAFATYDPGRTGRISTQDFRKVLRCFRVSLTEEDFFHLSSFFDASALGTISYNDFLRAYLH
ncbi:unnamed protein product [Lota lota]